MKHVLVFGDENILAAGVESMLAREDDLLVLGITNKCDHDEFSFEKEIDLFQPSVVIFDESTFLTEISYLYGIIKKYPQLRVIIVDEKENLVHILDKQVTMLAKSKDLINLIRKDQGNGR